MRGKRLYIFEKCLQYRITPAGAGKTRHSLPRKAERKDHPRRCGENENTGSVNIQRLGSPPQVRGKRPTGCNSKIYFGITPAGAGKTFDAQDIIDCIRDHPRRCGENTIG